MREYKPYQHQMGVEGPSFYREQQERHRQEQGRDQPKTQEPSAPPRQESMWETMFGLVEEERSSGPAVPKTAPDSFQRRGMSTVDPRQWFEVAKIWDYVGKTRTMPQYSGQVFVVDVLTRPASDSAQAAAEVAEFFRIPSEAFRGLNLEGAWKQVLEPFFADLAIGLNKMKPFVIPGALLLNIDKEGKLVLLYQDR